MLKFVFCADSKKNLILTNTYIYDYTFYNGLYIQCILPRSTTVSDDLPLGIPPESTIHINQIAVGTKYTYSFLCVHVCSFMLVDLWLLHLGGFVAQIYYILFCADKQRTNLCVAARIRSKLLKIVKYIAYVEMKIISHQPAQLFSKL